jgi:hypothetical protein
LSRQAGTRPDEMPPPRWSGVASADILPIRAVSKSQRFHPRSQ